MLHGGDTVAREIAKQFTLELALPTPEASSVQPVAEQPLELSRRSRQTEGLSDKNFLSGVVWKKCQPQFTYTPKSPSFRNLSSNGVRYKFREREKVEITVPTKSDAKHTFDGVLDDVERNILRYARSSSIHDGGVAYDAVVRCNLQITIG